MLYQAYLTAIVAVVAVVLASSVVGDEQVSAAQARRVIEHGPAWIGVAAAVVVALGLRSGSRGGPLALERAEVRHVLLAPVDRTFALRAPAIRQLRFLGFVGLVAGGAVGQLASKRFEGHGLQWVAAGALAGATLVGLGAGAALVSSGLRAPRWSATAAGVLLIGAAVADGMGALPASATAAFGHLALWPLRASAVAVVPVGVAVVLVGAGLGLLGHQSLEAAERRSRLVGQLRFAATLQDLRTVIVLRRQLAMELPRLRPWIRLPLRGTGRAAVVVRGIRGVLRWPAARWARLVLLGTVAGLALRGAWAGTTPLLVAAGLALFVAGLDAVEPLAQEVDHPSRRDASPLEAGDIHLRHVPVGVLAQGLVAVVAIGVAAAPGDGRIPSSVAAVVALPLALGSVAGAVVSVLSGPPSTDGTWTMAPPEAQGLRLAVRTAWPPGLAVIGTLPVLAARAATGAASRGVRPATAAGLAIVGLFTLVCGWVRVRDDISAWWAQQMEQSSARR